MSVCKPEFQLSAGSLSTLSSGKHVKSPFRYPGGKYYALRLILPFIVGVPHDEYREPFLGGGNVFFAKPKARYNWLNDLEPNLVTTYKVIADATCRQRLIEKVSNEVATRERHTEMKSMKATSPLDIAYRTYYLNRTSYSGIINVPAWGYADGKSSPPQNWGKFIEQAGQKLVDVQITRHDFSEVISARSRGETVFMYLDPPYFHADQKRAYEMSFTTEDHERLGSLLRKTPYLFCLSYDDCEEIRDLYSWAEIHERVWQYTTANVKGKNSRRDGRELVITNYKVVQPQQMRLLDS